MPFCSTCMGMFELVVGPLDTRVDLRKCFVLVVVRRYSIVVGEEFGGTAVQEEGVESLEPVAVAFEAVVGILEVAVVVVVRIAVRRALRPLEQAHNIPVEILLMAEYNYRQSLLVEVDLEGFGMQMESQAFDFEAMYKEPSLAKSCSVKSDSEILKEIIPSWKLYPSCSICSQPWRTPN